MFLSVLGSALGVTLPIFVMLMFGVFLRRSRWIDDAFVEKGSKLVFQFALPTVLFLSISQANFDQAFDVRLIAVGLLGTLAAWMLLEGLLTHRIMPKAERGVVVQGSFRANMGIIGLAYCFNAYGEVGLVNASMYLALVTILYNVLSVVSLNRWAEAETQWSRIAKGVVSNPLIIAICVAIPFSIFGIKLPGMAATSLGYVAQLALPLALICTGASLSFSSLKARSANASITVLAKLLMVPAFIVVLGFLAGLSGMQLGIVLLMASAPTAAASYVMVRAIGGNATLAANVIAVTTMLGVFTTSGLFAIASGLGWL